MSLDLESGPRLVEMSEVDESAEAAVQVDVSGLMLPEDLVQKASAQVERRREVEALLKTAYERREKVKPEIFERVVQDFEARLEQFQREYSPLKAELEHHLHNLRFQETQLRDKLGRVEDLLQEIEFRTEIGELAPEIHAERHRGAEEERTGLRVQIDLVESSFSTAEVLLDEPLDTVLKAIDRKLAEEEESLALTGPNGLGVGQGISDKPVGGEDSDSLLERVGSDRGSGPDTGRLLAGRPLGDDKEPETRLDFPRIDPSTLKRSPGDDCETAGLTTLEVSGKGTLTLNRDGGGLDFLVEEGFSLGRSRSNDVVIQGQVVSRRHAVVRIRGGVFAIEDVSSGGGVRVNGEPVALHALVDGDQIEVGGAVFDYSFVVDEPAEGVVSDGEAEAEELEITSEAGEEDNGLESQEEGQIS